MGLFLTRTIPEVDSLQFSTPRLMTRIYGRDGQVLQEYGAEKRTLVRYSEISPNFINALISVEDADFYHHHGISFRGLLRAAMRDILHRKASQGGSTLTQQLARQYFLTPEKTIVRKIREAILAVNIESRYSKDQILEMYANKVCFGQAYYGVEASSQYYFGKPAKDLTVPEGALLAGIVQLPTYNSPVSHPDRALDRRNWVLLRMWKTGHLTQAQYEKYRREPLGLALPSSTGGDFAGYVTERVRIYLADTYGEDALYLEGLQVSTTIDPRLQAMAEEAVKSGLDNYGHRRGYKGPSRGPGAPSEYKSGRFVVNGRYWGTVSAVEPDAITVTLGQTTATLKAENWSWTQNIRPEKTFQKGDRVLLLCQKTGPEPVFQLEQKAIAQGALVAVEPHTGDILALVGGYDFGSTMYNRADQARRQTGSAVKPLIYATALSNGFTLADQTVDEPTLFLTGREQAANLCAQGYIPRDFDKDYFGLITLRTALEHSVNICAVKLLNRTGYSKVIDTAKQLHITTQLQPYPSLALGAFEISLQELTGAYTAFDNGGVWVQPRLITRVADHEGKTLESARSLTQPVFDARVAYLMTQAMTGVIKRGTAATVADMKGHFAGKTGTTNDYTDSWFMGFNPALLCGVWVGKDDHKPLGNLETGSRAALPIWRQFMEEATAGQEDLDWPRPPGIVEVLVDGATGLRAGVDSPCTDVRPEVFLEGSEPTAFCTVKDHFRLKLPYFLQSYPVTQDFALVMPEADMDAWVARYPGTVARQGPRQLLVSWGGTTFPVKVDVAPPREGPVPQAVMPGLPHEGDVACGARTEYVNEKQ